MQYSASQMMTQLIHLSALLAVLTNALLVLVLKRSTSITIRARVLLVMVSTFLALYAASTLLDAAQLHPVIDALYLPKRFGMLAIFSVACLSLDRWLVLKHVLRNLDSPTNVIFGDGGVGLLLVLVPFLASGLIFVVELTLKIPTTPSTWQALIASNAGTISRPCVIGTEIFSAILFLYVVRRSKRLVSEFRLPGIHQSLGVRVALKETAELSNGLCASLLMHCLVTLSFVGTVLPAKLLGVSDGSAIFLVPYLLFQLHGTLHPLLLTRRCARLKAQALKLGGLKLLLGVCSGDALIDCKVQPNIQYMEDLKLAWGNPPPSV